MIIPKQNKIYKTVHVLFHFTKVYMNAYLRVLCSLMHATTYICIKYHDVHMYVQGDFLKYQIINLI
jgi:hypothetical protein